MKRFNGDKVERPAAGWVFVFLFFLIPCSFVSADTIKLRDGRLHENVIAISQKGGMFIVHSTGRTEFLPTRKIRFVSLSRVSWKYRVSRRGVRKLVDKLAEENWESKKGGASVMLDLNRARPKKDKEPSKPFIERGAAGFRSLAIPGWGQYYQGRNFRAGFHLVSTLLLGYGYIESAAFADRGRDKLDFAILSTIASLAEPGSAFRNYFIARSDAGRAAKDITNYSNQANGMALVLLLLYAWNVYDAFTWTPDDDAFRYSPPSHASRLSASRDSVLNFSWSKRF